MDERSSPQEPVESPDPRPEEPSPEGFLGRCPTVSADEPSVARSAEPRTRTPEELVASLYHVHLPRLREEGLVVENGEGFEFAGGPVVGDVLEAVEPYERDR